MPPPLTPLEKLTGNPSQLSLTHLVNQTYFLKVYTLVKHRNDIIKMFNTQVKPQAKQVASLQSFVYFIVPFMVFKSADHVFFYNAIETLLVN